MTVSMQEMLGIPDLSDEEKQARNDAIVAHRLAQRLYRPKKTWHPRNDGTHRGLKPIREEGHRKVERAVDRALYYLPYPNREELVAGCEAWIEDCAKRGVPAGRDYAEFADFFKYWWVSQH